MLQARIAEYPTNGVPPDAILRYQPANRLASVQIVIDFPSSKARNGTLHALAGAA